jgi:hypothetical protein
LLLIGHFDDVQAVLGQNPLDKLPSKSYQGVLDAKRGLSIIEFPADSTPCNDLHTLAITKSINALWFGVIRDYGMFDRVEAPTQFA